MSEDYDLILNPAKNMDSGIFSNNQEAADRIN